MIMILCDLTVTSAFSPLSGQEKLQKFDDIKKSSIILENGIGIECYKSKQTS